MSCESHEAPHRLHARDIPPSLAIESGYNIYLAQKCEAASPLGRSARLAIAHFDALLGHFDDLSPEGVYCFQLRLAANSLASGIERRKLTLAKALAAIEAEKNGVARRIAQTESWWGILKGGWQLLLAGGIAYAIVHAIFRLPALSDSTVGMNQQYAALSTALGIALIGSFWKSRSMNARLLGAFDRYREAVDKAHRDYSRDVVIEYQLAAVTANDAWKTLTSEDPPVSAEFHALLLRNMSAPEAETSAAALAPAAP